jgi:hypothetical protein
MRLEPALSANEEPEQDRHLAGPVAIGDLSPRKRLVTIMTRIFLTEKEYSYIQI